MEKIMHIPEGKLFTLFPICVYTRPEGYQSCTETCSPRSQLFAKTQHLLTKTGGLLATIVPLKITNTQCSVPPPQCLSGRVGSSPEILLRIGRRIKLREERVHAPVPWTNVHLYLFAFGLILCFCSVISFVIFIEMRSEWLSQEGAWWMLLWRLKSWKS